MGVAAYNRGSKILSDEADAHMSSAQSKADWLAQGDEITRLRQQVVALEHRLRQAKRCLAAERAGRENLRVRLIESEQTHISVVRILCKALGRAGVPGFESTENFL